MNNTNYFSDLNEQWMNKLVNLLGLGLALVWTSCESTSMQTTVTGTGSPTSEERTAASFEKIDAEGAFTVIYKKSATPSIKIYAEQNLLPYIQTTVSGSTLTIQPKNGYVPVASGNNTIVVRVSSPKVCELSMLGTGLLSADTIWGTSLATSLNGAGSIAVRYARGTKLTAELQGAGTQEIGANVDELSCSLIGTGRFILSGKAKTLKHEIEGSGIVEGYPLTCNTSNAVILGSGICYLYVNNSLNVRINGSGKLLYKGSVPATAVSVNVTGSGTVLKSN